jgi:hypothetical protein
LKIVDSTTGVILFDNDSAGGTGGDGALSTPPPSS